MNYKLLIYIFNIMLSIFSLSGVNFEKLIKKDKVMETRILVIAISLIMAYLLTNFIFDFIEVSKIV